MSETGSSGEQIASRLFPRIQCEDQVTFDVDHRGGCAGVVKTLSVSGCLLVSIERMKVGTDLVLNLTLIRGDESTVCSVSGKIVNIDNRLEKPLFGYGIMFSSTNSDAVREAVRQVVEARMRATESSKKVPPPPPRTKSSVEPPPAKPSQEKKRISSIHASKTRSLLFTFIGVALFAGSIVLYSQWQKSKLISQFKGSVPVKEIKVVEQDVFVKVKGDWADRTSSQEKEQQLRLFGKLLVQNKMQSAVFFTEGGKKIAMVMIERGSNSKEPWVRLEGN